jgi:hypothetical protein
VIIGRATFITTKASQRGRKAGKLEEAATREAAGLFSHAEFERRGIAGRRLLAEAVAAHRFLAGLLFVAFRTFNT